MLDSYAEQYTSPFSLWLGPMLCVYISDAGNAELVFKSKDCVNRPKFFTKIIRETVKVDGIITLECS